MTSRCRSCGGRDFTDAIDNHGKVYRGCARCRIVPIDPQRIEDQRAAEPAAVSGEMGRE